MVQQVAELMFGASLANTLGAFEIGVAVSLFLFGIVSLQVYYYNEHYENDRLEIKASVSKPLMNVIESKCELKAIH
jgi:hypothetical protein